LYNNYDFWSDTFTAFFGQSFYLDFQKKLEYGKDSVWTNLSKAWTTTMNALNDLETDDSVDSTKKQKFSIYDKKSINDVIANLIQIINMQVPTNVEGKDAENHKMNRPHAKKYVNSYILFFGLPYIECQWRRCAINNSTDNYCYIHNNMADNKQWVALQKSLPIACKTPASSNTLEFTTAKTRSVLTTLKKKLDREKRKQKHLVSFVRDRLQRIIAQEQISTVSSDDIINSVNELITGCKINELSSLTSLLIDTIQKTDAAANERETAAATNERKTAAATSESKTAAATSESDI